MRKKSILVCLTLIPLLPACAHRRPVLPDASAVKVAREDAPAKCRDVGAVEGRTASAKGTREQALEDLKRDAADRGSNYVVVKDWSAYGTSVTGRAYVCP